MSDFGESGTNFHCAFLQLFGKSCTFAKEAVGRHGKMCLVLQLAPQTSTLNHLLRGYPRDPNRQKLTIFQDRKNGVKL